MNHHKTFLIFLWPVLILLQACGGDEGGVAVQAQQSPSPGFAVFWGSCDNSEPSEVNRLGLSKSESIQRNCHEWYGGFFVNINLQQLCKSIPEGVLLQNYCSDDDLIGVCTTPIGIESEIRIYYYSSDWTSSKAQKDCTKQDSSAKWLDLFSG